MNKDHNTEEYHNFEARVTDPCDRQNRSVTTVGRSEQPNSQFQWNRCTKSNRGTVSFLPPGARGDIVPEVTHDWSMASVEAAGNSTDDLHGPPLDEGSRQPAVTWSVISERIQCVHHTNG